jgi:transposase-like protein
MTHLTPIRPTGHHGLQSNGAPLAASRPAELADRARAAYIEIGCPTCSRANAVTVSQLKDVTRSVLICDGCGASYQRDKAVSLTLLSAIGRNPESHP